MDWCLPCFDRDHVDNGAFGPSRPLLSLWEWQAARMSNYMLYLIDHEGFKPKYYCPCDPVNPICILTHHVCRLYGVKIANMLCGNRSISQMYSTIEYFHAVGPVKESVPQDAFKDLIWCMHFSDD